MKYIKKGIGSIIILLQLLTIEAVIISNKHRSSSLNLHQLQQRDILDELVDDGFNFQKQLTDETSKYMVSSVSPKSSQEQSQEPSAVQTAEDSKNSESSQKQDDGDSTENKDVVDKEQETLAENKQEDKKQEMDQMITDEQARQLADKSQPVESHEVKNLPPLIESLTSVDETLSSNSAASDTNESGSGFLAQERKREESSKKIDDDSLDQVSAAEVAKTKVKKNSQKMVDEVVKKEEEEDKSIKKYFDVVDTCFQEQEEVNRQKNERKIALKQQTIQKYEAAAQIIEKQKDLALAKLQENRKEESLGEAAWSASLQSYNNKMK